MFRSNSQALCRASHASFARRTQRLAYFGVACLILLFFCAPACRAAGFIVEDFATAQNFNTTASSFSLDGISYQVAPAMPMQNLVVTDGSLQSLSGESSNDNALWFNATGTDVISSITIKMTDGKSFNIKSLDIEAVANANIVFLPNGNSSGSISIASNGNDIVQTVNLSAVNPAFSSIAYLTIQGGALEPTIGHIVYQELAPLSISPGSLPDAEAGATYSQTFTASGGTGPYTYSTGPLPAGLLLNSSTGKLSGTPSAVGIFTIAVTATDANQNTGTINLTLRIGPPNITLSPTALADGKYGSVYPAVMFSAGGGNAPYTYSAVGLPPGTTINVNSGVLSGTPTKAGTYTISVTAQDSTTGTGAPFSQTNVITWVIDKVPLTITASGATKVYGAALPAFSASYSGFVGGDSASSLTTLPTFNTTATSTSSVGTYPITASGAVDPNYSISYVGNTLTVTPVQLTVTAGNATMVYGGAFPALGVSYNGFVNGDNASSLTTQPVETVPATPFSPVGSYTITPSAAVDPNYTFLYRTGTLTITPAPLTITANNAAMTYGGAVPALAASYGGFQNGDNASNLTVPPTIATTATSASAVGTFPITASGAVDPNYTISYVSGTMTVGKATLTATADNKFMPLGGPVPTLTITYTGFVNADNVSSLTSPCIATTPANAGSPAGTYIIGVANGSSPNYTFHYVPGALTVAKATLTITANNAQSAYGSPLVPNSSLTVSYSGFINGDSPSSLTVPPTVINTAFVGAPAGTYALIPSGAVDPNYTIVYVDGTYAINSAALNIQAGNASSVYGSAIPTFTVTYTGFVNGDGASSLAPAPTISTTATSASPVGTYPITAHGAFDPNYVITYTPGTFTVKPAALTITANNASRAYGAPNPAFGASYASFVNGDSAARLTTPPSFSTTATATSAPGTYAIVPGSAVDPNYTIAYINGTLTITQATQTIALTTTAPTSPVVGAAYSPAATASSGLTVAFSIDATSSTGACTLAGSVVSFTGTGNCIIDANQAGNANYAAAAQAQQTIAIGKAAPAATTVTSSTNPATVGQNVTFTAKVTPQAGNPIPRGNVDFVDTMTSTTLCSQVALVGGSGNASATCASTDLAVGTHTIQASYGGDANTAKSSATYTQTIAQAMGGLNIASSANPAVLGQSVTFTATVTSSAPTNAKANAQQANAAAPFATPAAASASPAATPTGTVSFSDGTTTLGSATLVNGSVNLTTAFATPGTHTITAVYSGDADTQSATATFAQGVNAPVVPAPALSTWMLGLLGALLAAMGLMRGRSM